MDITTEQIRADLTHAIAKLVALTDCTVEWQVGTGGNCTADIITAPDGRTLYLTDGDSRIPFGESHELHPMWSNVTMSYYDAFDDEDGYCSGDLQMDPEQLIENVISTISEWIDGHPYRDEIGNQVLDADNHPVESVAPIVVQPSELDALRQSIVDAIRLGFDDDENGGDCIAGISLLMQRHPDLAKLAEQTEVAR